MRKLFIILLTSTLSFNGFSQQWEMHEMGNAFDGFGKMCAVEGMESNPDGTMLAVINYSDELILEHSTNGMMSQLFIKLIINGDFVNNDYNITKILMSFDREKDFYIIGRFNHYLESNSITIDYALSTNYNTCLNKFDIASSFKEKQVVNFRIHTNSNHYDFSFPLSGSTAAINKTFKNPNYQKAENWTDFAIESLSFMGLMASADSGELNLNSASGNCLAYFKIKYGEYYYLLIESVYTNKTDSINSIVFKDYIGDIIAEIPYKIAFKNVFFFSGNTKIRQNKKYKKDLETLDIYFDNLKTAEIIDNDSLSFEQFCTLSEKELLSIYNDIKAYGEFFDWMRIRENVFLHYEIEEYTFKVFLEPWGI